MIVITTPTGDIGHRHVVQGSEPVRVIAHDPSRIPQEIRQCAEVIQGSHGDAATIDKALTGADALFWLIPPEPLMTLNSVDEAYVGFTRPAAEAIRKCAVKRVVAISAIGRGWHKWAGLATANIKADDLLASTGVALRVLVMPSFMGNLLRQAQSIKEKGLFSSPIDADPKAPTVATKIGLKSSQRTRHCARTRKKRSSSYARCATIARCTTIACTATNAALMMLSEFWDHR